jgi:hypothetical protein
MKMALIRNIHFSNSTGSFPIYLDVFPCHRQDIYRTFTILYLKYTEYHGGCLISNMNCLLTRSHHHFCSFWWCSCCLSLQYVLFVLVVSCVQSVFLGCDHVSAVTLTIWIKSIVSIISHVSGVTLTIWIKSIVRLISHVSAVTLENDTLWN